MIDVQHYITTECLAADLRGLIKGFTYDKKGNWKKRNGKTQKCSNVIGKLNGSSQTIWLELKKQQLALKVSCLVVKTSEPSLQSS